MTAAQPPKFSAESAARVARALEAVGRRWLEIELALIPVRSPFRDSLPATGPRIHAPCYEASVGPVHYRGCACRR